MTEKKVTLALAMIVAIAVVGMLIAGLGAFALDSGGITLSGAALVSLSGCHLDPVGPWHSSWL